MSISEKENLSKFIKSALKEDVGDGDHTSLATIAKGTKGFARLLIKEDGILAGVEVAKSIFDEVDMSLQLDVKMNDGAAIKSGDIAFTVEGSVHSILIAERLVLNLMQRMSAIATSTAKAVQALKGTKAKVLDTRKTTPGLRSLEKLAVRIGGGVNHRFGLYDMILVKDNHVDYAGGVTEALKAVESYVKRLNKKIEVEVEVRNFNELDEVIAFGFVDRILLDNFNCEDVKEAVKRINGRFTTEASGGINAENAREYAESGVDFISIGALTHSVKSLDMSLKAQLSSK